ncbi:MAG: serine hydrolase domain-containing protein [Myxococcota bacterium]|nr:serine hydrolase domain-containing protein [Myxococcota bacterium]
MTRYSAQSRRFLLVLLFALSTWPGHAADLETLSALGFSEERLDRIRRVLRDHVDHERIAGVVALLARRGKVAFFESYGERDLERAEPMTDDTIFRIASMSKPITSVAVLMLYEQGHFLLDDPVSLYLPELGALEVAVEQDAAADLETVPAQREMTIQDLLRHTSGLTYGFFSDSRVDQLYLERGVLSRDATTAETVSKLAALPLKHQPGSTWEYSISVDVLGRLVEVVSGLPFDRFLEEQIFAPLGMDDTGFHVPKSALPRVAVNYQWKDEQLVPAEVNPVESFEVPTTYFSGGGGLVSTAADYYRFCQMLLNGGELGGRRLLGRKTVEWMTSDHLGEIEFARRPGYGFGLGFAIRTDVGLAVVPGSLGEFNWGGAYGTSFWIDPAEDFIGIFMIQLRPAPRAYRQQFKGLAYQAIVD